MAASMYLCPICPSMTLLFVTAAVLGTSCGAYDATQIVWIMEIWQNEAGPFIQAQHFSYALGSLVPSLVLAPFLTKEPEEEEGVSTTTTESSANPTQKLVVPFIIVGVFVSLAALTQLLLYIFARYYPPPPEQGRLDAKPVLETNNDDKMGDTPVKKIRNWYRIKLIALTAVFIGMSQGMEMCTFQFMSTFAQKGGLGLSESQGANIQSGLTGSFAVGRGLGILIILRIPPQLIMCVNLVLVVCGSIILLVFADNSHALLWTGTVVLGLGYSTIYASFCAFIERHLMFTQWVGAFILIFGSSIPAIYPLIVGGLIDENPGVVTYTNFFSVAWCTVALAVASKLVYDRRKQAKNQKKLSTVEGKY